MLPNLFPKFPLVANKCWRAHDENTATLVSRENKKEK